MPTKRSASAGGAEGRRITPELVRDALACVPPDIDRETWARVAMALKASELPEPAARALFHEWSAGGQTYKQADADATWRSVKGSGGTTVATLFGIAKDHGFRFPKDGEAASMPPQAAAEAERLAQAAAKRRAAEEAAYRERADKAARAARELWDGAAETGRAAYLARKGVQAHGVRFLPDGTLLVPMRDAAGELQNVQRVAPEKPAGGGPDKRYMPGSRKAGLFHLVGDAERCTVLLVAEGYATASTLHEATGRPVAVAFDAGNLPAVAKALRERHPAATLLLCGDDDRDTEARSGTNPGRQYAAQAARAVHQPGAPAGAVFPEGLPEGGTDFNDLAAHAGLDAVRDQVERAAADPQVPKARRAAKSGRGGPNGGAEHPRGRGVPGAAPGEPAAPDRWGFVADDGGIWHCKRDGDGWGKRVWLCAPLRVTARTRTNDASGWGYLLEFSDFDGNAKSWAMPSALLSGEGAEWAARLRDMGLNMAVGAGVRTQIATFINTRQPAERITCTSMVGWHGNVYVLPSGTIGPAGAAGAGRRFVFQSDGVVEDTFRQRGSLAAWQGQIGALCQGNSRLAFAVCCALAGPLLPFTGLEGGGFHLRGDSRGGKTTALRAAASVYGGPNYMQQWRTTANALESTAVQHNHALLVLDELGQLDPWAAGETAYLLSNGKSKNRSTRAMLLRKRPEWLLIFLSSGEVSMADLMAEVGKRARPGQEVRMVDVPLDAGMGMGGIEQLHEFDSPAELAEALKDGTMRTYGVAGRTWLQWCADHHGQLETLARDEVERQRVAFVPKATSGQVRTVGGLFALVAAAGELATRAGVTGWEPGEATRAGRMCFEAWLAARGHLDNSEQVAMFRQVRGFLEKNGESLFTWTQRGHDDHKPNTPLRVGFKRRVDETGEPLRVDTSTTRHDDRSQSEWEALHRSFVEYLVLPEQFKREVCKGFDPVSVAKVLRERGHLKHEGDRYTMKQRLPGMPLTSVYIIKPSIFGDDL